VIHTWTTDRVRPLPAVSPSSTFEWAPQKRPESCQKKSAESKPNRWTELSRKTVATNSWPDLVRTTPAVRYTRYIRRMTAFCGSVRSCSVRTDNRSANVRPDRFRRVRYCCDNNKRPRPEGTVFCGKFRVVLLRADGDDEDVLRGVSALPKYTVTLL